MTKPTDFDTLTRKHRNLGNHLSLIAHIEQQTGITPHVSTDGEGSHTATWWEGKLPAGVLQTSADDIGQAVIVATDMEDDRDTTFTYIYVGVREGPTQSVAGLAAELADAQLILERIQRAAETHAIAPERHGERVS